MIKCPKCGRYTYTLVPVYGYQWIYKCSACGYAPSVIYTNSTAGNYSGQYTDNPVV